MDIAGKVVIVTGASSGIGVVTAEALVRRGAAVVLAARRTQEIEQLAERLRQSGGRALAVQTDVSQLADIEHLVESALAEFGRIDVLINNAGVGGGATLMGTKDSRITQTITVNLLAPVRLAQAVVPAMRQQGAGVIVNIGSVAGEVGFIGVYSATKFGLRGFNDALRRELKKDRIDVVLVAPGFIATPMTEGLKIPMPGPEVVANVILDVIHRPRRKVILPWVYRPMIFLAAMFPWVTDQIVGSSWLLKMYRDRKNKEQAEG